MQKWDFDWSYWDRILMDYDPKNSSKRIEDNRVIPDWDEYFIRLAKFVSVRSKDIHTQHGAVLTDKHNKIISTGYNSYIGGLNDNEMPNNRPDKYKWMRHAEENTILQSPTHIRNLEDPRIYITGRCCLNCAQLLISSGINHWIFLEDGSRWGVKSLEDDVWGDAKDFLWLVKTKKIHIEWISLSD